MRRKTGHNNKDLYAVIMAGGKGTRFWPLSRESFPKQFLKLVGQNTLIQDTIHRVNSDIPHTNIIVVTTSGQKDIVQWQVREISDSVRSIVEPTGKNTAPAICLVAMKLYKENKNAVMFVLPSDHHVQGGEAFRATMYKALPHAQKGKIVTFGITPYRPETGYGYIKSGKKIVDSIYGVQRFVEKPDKKTAKKYLDEGGYFWNSGMFMFKAKTIMDEIKALMPDMYAAFKQASGSFGKDDEDKAMREAYEAVSSESIDYGVMEKSDKVVVVGADFQWSDIGSWSALEEVMPKDKRRNVKIGNIVELDSSGSIFFSSEKLVAAVGLKDMVVVNTADAVLIVPKAEAQRVKDLVDALKNHGKVEYLEPTVEERPWGYFSVLEKGPTHKIKHICVKPKGKLSHQMHNHRSEHWIVVSGTAKVHKGEEVLMVHKNESTYIPAAVRHSLENPGLIPLKIIEIQSGEYLGEDDIIRFDDNYGRTTKK